MNMSEFKLPYVMKTMRQAGDNEREHIFRGEYVASPLERELFAGERFVPNALVFSGRGRYDVHTGSRKIRMLSGPATPVIGRYVVADWAPNYEEGSFHRQFLDASGSQRAIAKKLSEPQFALIHLRRGLQDAFLATMPGVTDYTLAQVIDGHNDAVSEPFERLFPCEWDDEGKYTRRSPLDGVELFEGRTDKKGKVRELRMAGLTLDEVVPYITDFTKK